MCGIIVLDHIREVVFGLVVRSSLGQFGRLNLLSDDGRVEELDFISSSSFENQASHSENSPDCQDYQSQQQNCQHPAL